MAISTNQFKNGNHIEVDGTVFKILEFQHVKPGKGGAFVRTKLRRAADGAVIDRTFRAGEKFRPVRTEARKFQFLYADGTDAHFMDEESFEQIALPETSVTESLKYIKPNESVDLLYIDDEPGDIQLGASVERYGPPPLWSRDPSYATLVHLILEQQVSLASAQAAFDRLRAALDGSVEPEPLLRLTDEELRAIGFSRQKAGYARTLANAMLDGFDLGALASMPDDEVRKALFAMPGIGPWTADIYLTMCLLRPDVWPHGDQALATAARELLELPEQPTFDELEIRARSWRPHRATAARILWHHYLSVRGRA